MLFLEKCPFLNKHWRTDVALMNNAYIEKDERILYNNYNQTIMNDNQNNTMKK